MAKPTFKERYEKYRKPKVTAEDVKKKFSSSSSSSKPIGTLILCGVLTLGIAGTALAGQSSAASTNSAIAKVDQEIATKGTELSKLNKKRTVSVDEAKDQLKALGVRANELADAQNAYIDGKQPRAEVKKQIEKMLTSDAREARGGFEAATPWLLILKEDGSPAEEYSWSVKPGYAYSSNDRIPVVFLAKNKDSVLYAYVTAYYVPSQNAFTSLTKGLTMEGSKALGSTEAGVDHAPDEGTPGYDKDGNLIWDEEEED